MELTLQRATRNQTIRFLLMHDDGRLGPKTGLTAHSEGLTVAYLRDGQASPTPVVLAPWMSGSHVTGSFRELDAHLMPGLYELALPDEICAEGAKRATLMIQAPGVSPQVIHMDLVAYDPYDRDRLGLDCLSREARHQVISTAFREVVPEIIEEFRRKPEPGASAP